MLLVDRFLHVQQDIAKIALECGRNPDEITLVAVTKSVAWQQVKPVYDIGQRDFGESRLQEWSLKKELAPKDCRWHMIGSLQKNKVAKAIDNFALIHSVDTFELAAKISECSINKKCTTHILLQANTSGEKSKHGYTSGQWKECFNKVIDLPALSIDGLMTMAPYTDDEARIRGCFSNLRHLQGELIFMADGRAPLHNLSMGMSHDYHIAISEGATILRIGSFIFKSISLNKI